MEHQVVMLIRLLVAQVVVEKEVILQVDLIMELIFLD